VKPDAEIDVRRFMAKGGDILTPTELPVRIAPKLIHPSP
jgi:hypothetical protein